MMVVIATDEPEFYSKDRFNNWLKLAEDLKNIKVDISDNGNPIYKSVVDSIFSEAHLFNIVKDKNESKFSLDQIVKTYPLNQDEVDSVQSIIKSLDFYKDIVYKDSTNLHLMMLFMNKEIFNSNKRGCY